MGVVIGYVLCTFIFELHARLWQILLLHVLLLALALFVGLVFLQGRSETDSPLMPIWTRIKRPFIDSRDLLVQLKQHYQLISFILLLLALFFYEFFRLGSSSIYYLYLHRMSFNDTQYAAYFTCEQIATCLALIALALLRKRWQMNDLHLCIAGLCLSSVGPLLFAFAQNHKAMIFGGKRFAFRDQRKQNRSLRVLQQFRR